MLIYIDLYMEIYMTRKCHACEERSLYFFFFFIHQGSFIYQVMLAMTGPWHEVYFFDQNIRSYWA